MPYYAVVFKTRFAPGDHWNPNATADDSDRQQDWPVGALYSLGTVLPSTLPSHLEAIELPGPQPENTIWDAHQRTFVPALFDRERAAARARALRDELTALETEIAAKGMRR